MTILPAFLPSVAGMLHCFISGLTFICYCSSHTIIMISVKHVFLVIIAGWCFHMGEGYSLNREDEGWMEDVDSVTWDTEEGSGDSMDFVYRYGSEDATDLGSDFQDSGNVYEDSDYESMDLGTVPDFVTDDGSDYDNELNYEFELEKVFRLEQELKSELEEIHLEGSHGRIHVKIDVD